jgi:heptosyltransferase I
MNILLVRFSALGDVSLVVPAVRRIQNRLPEASITWLTSPNAYCLLSGLSGVEFIVADKPKCFSDYLHIRRLLTNQSFDILLAMQASLRINLIYPFVKAKRKIGFDRVRARDGQYLFTNEKIDFHDEHLLESFLSFATKIGAENGGLSWDFALTPEEIQWADTITANINSPIVALNPFSSKIERNWLTDRYVGLISAIRKRWQASIILTGGTAEKEIGNAKRIESMLDFPVNNLVGKTTPKQLAALLSKVSCLIAPDTGPVHIATAVGTPVVGLYAVAPPKLTGPYLSPELVVDKYPDAVKHLLGKDPEKVPWNTRVHRGNPMSLIEISDVINKLSLVLNRA